MHARAIEKENLHSFSFFEKVKKIYVFSGLMSLLLSLWASARESVINTDAMCYLQSAADVHQGLHTAMHVCGQAKWPFYSVLIYALSYLTSCSYTVSAYTLDACFTLISVLAFLSIIRFIIQNNRVLWFAAIVILLAHEFNAVRQYIIRDHGFWAFYLVSIVCLLHYLRHSQWKYALAWGVSLAVATLFRIEGALFLLFVPFVVWLDSRKTFLSRCIAFFQLHTITLLSGLSLLIWIFLHPQIDLTRINELQFQLLHGITSIQQHVMHVKAALAEAVLGPDSANDAGMVLCLMLVSWYVQNVIMNVSVVYMALIVYAWVKRLLNTERFIHLVLWSYLLTNVVITFAFLAEHFFLSKRYLIGLSLVLMIWVPFALEELFVRRKVRAWPMTLAIFFIVVSSLGGIFDFGYSKKYIHDAGDWLSLHVPPAATLYSNDPLVMYYSHHFGDTLFQKAQDFSELKVISHGKWQQYDYLALRVDKKTLNDETNVLNEIHYTLAQVFFNKRGDQVRIYRRNEL